MTKKPADQPLDRVPVALERAAPLRGGNGARVVGSAMDAGLSLIVVVAVFVIAGGYAGGLAGAALAGGLLGAFAGLVAAFAGVYVRYRDL